MDLYLKVRQLGVK
uniref:Uncharacterized protein n=1 Tax=Arundo donax TaxID=35708 RepID=A0A0A8Z4L6_ARUDO